MSRSHSALDRDWADYIDGLIEKPDPVAQSLIEETARLPLAVMQISPGQAHFMNLFVAAIGAKRTLEIGVFTGYSTLATARALPPDGTIIACDVSEEWTDIGQRHWRRAGVAEKIKLHLGPAMATLDQLLSNGEAGSFDFAFVDADKGNYWGYCDRCLDLLRPGGVLAVDNALWDGAVLDPKNDDEETVAIRETNKRLAADPRADNYLLPLGDGLHLARRL